MCGVLGVYCLKTAEEIPLSVAQSLLQLLIHRGQDASGLCWNDEYSVHQMEKNKGPPSGINVPEETSHLFIGSTRYPTLGDRKGEVRLRKFAQPFSFQTNLGMLSIAHNGNITNMHDLSSTPMAYESDSEFITQRLGKHINYLGSLESALIQLATELDGSYSLVGMLKDKLISFRDPRGIRPLVYGFNGEHYVFASESIVLQQAGVDQVMDVNPGELIVVDESGITKKQLVEPKEIAHCYFEYVYFANSVSTINQRNVYEARLKLGEVLANQLQNDGITEFDYIVPVPDTSKAACETMSEILNRPMREAIMKNRSSLRTFIMPSVDARHQAAKSKYLFVDKFIKDKRILLVDDSIVRGFTMKFLIEILKEKGANSVDVVITCPPQKYACYYGVDFGTDSELIANRSQNIDAIRDEIGADSLTYLTLENMYKAIDLPKMCDACITGKYPTEHGQLIRLKVKSGEIDEDSTHYEIKTT